MNWQDKYLSPFIEREKVSYSKIKKIIKDFTFLFKHSLSFHEQPKEPAEQLPDFISEDTDIIYNVCKEFFDNANSRIDKLEDKAITLLSYVSALFAFISFIFINASNWVTKTMLIFSMGLLILSILISFRCVNVKGRKTFFLPDIFDFNSEVPAENFDRKSISKTLLNSAIYNQNIADNTADILKAARYTLVLAVIIGTTGFLLGVGEYFGTTESIEIVRIDNQIELTDIERQLDNAHKVLNEINHNINTLNNEKKLQEQIDKLMDEMKLIETNYQNLFEKLDRLENDTGANQ
ncbi:hypothetical protein [Clostridium formicaceticum]|uniref:Uncharacterized protein n=1 Tax=Clostridium formicaceticum TaxID=1497 RepID=A0AAC9RSX2_9CLOT|nr:hypothetical protein [Clostridium formicaceticum]AOY74992.1 hypothetical protein BJL90_02855 [Clostridium formicaceticum]ARE89405.1 hypothetical protein CLFO_38120 [Clostridium formicaceticum]